MFFIMRRSGLVILAFAVLILSLSLKDKKSESTIPTSAKPQSNFCVILDAGHGGFDGGAVAYDGTAEKDINLNITQKLRDLLEFNGVRVIMTRTEDTGTESISGPIARRKKSDLENRLALMGRNPDSIYVSIHLNKYTTSSAAGAQVFYTSNVDSAVNLAESVQGMITQMLQPENTRVVKAGGKNTYLLHKATVPAVIVECGFLSNHRELELLKNEEYQSKMAFAVANGILQYLSTCGT